MPGGYVKTKPTLKTKNRFRGRVGYENEMKV